MDEYLNCTKICVESKILRNNYFNIFLQCEKCIFNSDKKISY